MVSETVGDAFGQERVVRDSTALLRAGGHDVRFLAGRKIGEPSCDGIALVPELFRMNALTPRAHARRILDEAMGFLETVRPDVVHLVDAPDARFLRAITARYGVMATAHTVALTCPASGRFIRGDSVCAERSGWRCLALNKRYGCLSYFKSDLHRLHAIHEYRAKRRALVKARAVGAISRYVEATLRRDGWRDDQVRYVPNPVTAPLGVAPRAGVPAGLITCASRLVPMKGIDRLLGAVARLSGVEWALWICGDGPSRASLETLARDLGVAERVRFLGATPYAETQSLVAASRCLVQANLGPEGFGLAVAEASALGVPVVAFGVPALDEIVVHGETGLLARPGDADSLRDALHAVLADPERARALGENGRRLVRERYAPERHLEATVAAYAYCTAR